VKGGGSERYFIILIMPWNLILFLSESKNGIWEGIIKNCTFSEHLVVLAKLNLLANKSIYWSKGR
jgi:hypothetical protein